MMSVHVILRGCHAVVRSMGHVAIYFAGHLCHADAKLRRSHHEAEHAGKNSF